MSFGNISGVAKYSTALKMLHWIIACLVFMTWPLGLMIGYVKEEVKLDFYLIHESLGFLVLWLMLLRIGVRLTSSTPTPPAHGIEKFAANTVHALLYLFLVLMPVSGFLATNAHGFPLQWFGIVPVWSPVGKAPDIAPLLSTVHEWSAWILLVLFALHFAAVIFHHVVRKDAILHRML